MDRILVVDWSIDGNLRYLTYAILFSLIVRIVSSILRAMNFANNSEEIPALSWNAFKGFDADPKKGDRWFPFILGSLELMIYPFLMKAGLWSGIAAWIALKTLAQWKDWQENRSIFNRFLIGNILVLIFSFVILTKMVNLQLGS